MPTTFRSPDSACPSTSQPAPRNAAALDAGPPGQTSVHTLARRWGSSSASHGRAIVAGHARPSIPADRKPEREETWGDLIAACVGILGFLALATQWPLAWLAEVCR